MSPAAARGRRVVLAVIAVSLVTSAIVITSYVVLRGTDRLPFQLVRFVVTGVVCWCLYQRIPAARWFAILTFGVAALFGFTSGVVLLAWVHGMLAGTLAFSPAVRAYFGSKRD